MKFRTLIICAVYITFYQTFSQTKFSSNQEKIATALTNYFQLDRENIHLHLSKNVYLNNEQIYFKGYIIEKKYKPTSFTSNVYISLFDQSGKKISTQLYYAENEIFEGHVKLDKTLASGKYFLQVYTNYMNNFSENESSVFEITIVNASEKTYSRKQKTKHQNILTEFFPESGTFLQGTSNTIGVKITDCSGDGIAVQNAAIMDLQGNLVTNFSTDRFGYGKFDIHATTADLYKAFFVINEVMVEKNLPQAVATGINFSIINYMYPDKIILKIRTNANTLKDIKNSPFSLVFQQNDFVSFAEFSFNDDLEQIITISNTALADGINTVYLINQNLKKVGERIIYNPYLDANKTLLNIANKTNDSIAITGSSPIRSGSISVSILPSETVSESPKKTIQASLQFDNYLMKSSENMDFYLNNFSRKKHFELDSFLLTQKSKYDWDTMLAAAPKQRFDFDSGLTVKGTINSDFADTKKILVNMKSVILGLNESANLNDKQEFHFDHILAQDSTKIYFMAFENQIKKPGVRIYSQLLNNKKVFMKPFDANQNTCPDIAYTAENIPLPKIENSILIDSITIVSKRSKLVHQNSRSNMMARGFKISDTDAATYYDLLRFIESNGYTVSNRRGITFIENNSGRYLNVRDPDMQDPQTNGPAVYIDDYIIQNYDMLRDYGLNQIDEIYINKTGYDVSVRRSRGVIRIYTKKNSGIPQSALSKDSQWILIKDGFQGFQTYQNQKYDNVMDEGFSKLGTIDWKPFVSTDDNGTFHFSIPNLHQKTVRLIIEGISSNGQMISETILLDLNK